jgi:hypothetical protein
MLLASCPHVHFKGLGIRQSKVRFCPHARGETESNFFNRFAGTLWLCTLIAPNLSTHHDLIIKLLRINHSLLRQQRRSSLSSEQAAKL